MTSLILLALTAVFAAVAPGLFGAALINIAGFFIGIAGMLLDLSLRYLVVDFAKYIYSPVADAIGNTLWAAFRDISNILIIGMFTLIAVSIIIGAQSFNAKRMVAQVLIVAVLINFSLLFTRIIIEASNFVAGKFYSAMALDSSVNAASASASANSFDELINFASQSGISGQFISLLGLPSAFNARDTVNSVWSGNASYAGKLSGISASGGIAAIIYAFTTTALLLCTSIVLMYAVFLLIARTALLLFLLVTSSLAFGAYLIPKWGDHYWKIWWDSLLKNALFGPLLMLMLWTTMTLSYALVKGAGVRSFDKLFSDPTNGSGALALLIFFLILAMLYGSIRFASSFSSKIAGFNWAMAIPGGALAAPAWLTGAAYRSTFGKNAYRRLQQMDEQINTARKEGRTSDVLQLQREREQVARRARSDFNAMNTLVGDKVAKTLGLQGVLAGKSSGVGYGGRVEAKIGGQKDRFKGGAASEELERRLGEAQRTANERRAELQEERSRARDQERANREELRTSKDNAQREAKNAEQRLSSERSTIVREASTATREEHQRTLREMQENHQRDEDAATTAEDRTIRAARNRAREQAHMQEREVVIERAQSAALAGAADRLQPFEEALQRATRSLDDAEGGLRTLAETSRVAEEQHQEELRTVRNDARAAERTAMNDLETYDKAFRKGVARQVRGNRDVKEGVVDTVSPSIESRLKSRRTALDREESRDARRA